MVEKLQAENYITSNNLARYADVVFSEALPTKLFQDLHINNVKVAKKSNEKIIQTIIPILKDETAKKYR